MATRYDRLAANYLAFVQLASISYGCALMSPRPSVPGPITFSFSSDRDVKELTDAELTALIRSQLATDEERPEGESLN